MKADVVFKHDRVPCSVLHASEDNYFVVLSDHFADIAEGDRISGDFEMPNVRWFLNLTCSTLIYVKVLGRYPRLQLALQSANVPVATF